MMIYPAWARGIAGWNDQVHGHGRIPIGLGQQQATQPIPVVLQITHLLERAVPGNIINAAVDDAADIAA